jgi:hypothetical protein
MLPRRLMGLHQFLFLEDVMNKAEQLLDLIGEGKTKFKDLSIGDSFDFISPDRTLNSFFLRCEKTGPRKYKDSEGTDHKVGSTSVEVYHVEKAKG